MNCPTCGSATKRIKVHDENPFHYSECVECGWDDYDEQAVEARRIQIAQQAADAFLGDEAEEDDEDQDDEYETIYV